MVRNGIKNSDLDHIPKEKYVFSWMIMGIIYITILYFLRLGLLIAPNIIAFLWVLIFSNLNEEMENLNNCSERFFIIITTICIFGLISMLIYNFTSFSLLLPFVIISQFYVFGLLGVYGKQIIHQKRHIDTYIQKDPEKKPNTKKFKTLEERRREVIYVVLFAIGGCILLPLIFFMSETSNITYVLAIIISCIFGFAIIFRALEVYKKHSRETPQNRINVKL